MVERVLLVRRAAGALPRRLLLRAAVLAIGASVVLPALAPAGLPGTSQAWADDHLVITSDNSGGALVSASNLAPDEPLERCLRISHTAAGTRDELRLIVTSDGSALADFIDFAIEQGQGGRYGDCSGFTGTNVYQGSLASASREHGDELSALLIAPLAEGAGEVSVRLRFTVRSDNRAQGGSTMSDFTWIAGSADASAGGAGGPGPTPIPGGTSGERFQPTPGAAVTVPLVGPTAPPAKPSKKGDPLPPEAERNEAERNEAAGKADKKGILAAIWAQIRRIGTPLLKGAAFGLGMLPLVLLYLLIQNRIDRNDPKLAKAPSYATPHLMFRDAARAVG